MVLLVMGGTIFVATNIDHAIRRENQVHHIKYDHLK